MPLSKFDTIIVFDIFFSRERQIKYFSVFVKPRSKCTRSHLVDINAIRMAIGRGVKLDYRDKKKKLKRRKK